MGTTGYPACIYKFSRPYYNLRNQEAEIHFDRMLLAIYPPDYNRQTKHLLLPDHLLVPAASLPE